MERMEHGQPLLPGRPRLPNVGSFKTVQLNAAGWGALAAAGSVVGASAAWISRAPLVAAIGGGLAVTWAVARGLDQLRWRNSTVVIGQGNVPTEAWPEVVRRLESRGIQVTCTETVDEDTGDVQPGIECRQTDADTVRDALRQAARR